MLPSPIISFIKKHHVLTLSTCGNDGVWVSHCFYVFDEEKTRLIIISDLETKHAQHMLVNPTVAVGIALETRIVAKIQGLQIKAKAHLVSEAELHQVKKLYLLRFPYAALQHNPAFWSLDLVYVKMTDNRFGFGKKLIWEKEKE